MESALNRKRGILYTAERDITARLIPFATQSTPPKFVAWKRVRNARSAECANIVTFTRTRVHASNHP